MAKYPIETIRHSAAHVMAAAVQKLFGDVKFDIGPSTSDGFYYDFDMEHRLSMEDLAAIEDEMKKIVNAHLPFEYSEMSREETKALLESKNQPYKLERLADIDEGSKITFYTIGDFADLCRGPHVEHTGQIGAFKLMNVAGSYFRGDENNQMLQRIYGVAFPDKAELNAYLRMLEEAKKRDHRKLGKELKLFSFSEMSAPVWCCGTPKVRLSAMRLKPTGVKSITATATISCTRRTSARAFCGRPADTWIFTGMRCIHPWKSMKLITTSNP